MKKKKKTHTKKLSLEILLHGVVVADEDIATDGLVSRQRLRRRKRLESLLGTALTLLILRVSLSIALLAISILLPTLNSMDILVLPAFLVTLQPKIVVNYVMVKRRLVGGVNPLVEPAINPDARVPKLPIVERVKVGGFRLEAVPAVVERRVEVRAAGLEAVPAVVDRRGVAIEADDAIARVQVDIARRRSVDGDVAADSDVEVPPLAGALRRVRVAPDRVVEREVRDARRLVPELVAELKKLVVVILHLRWRIPIRIESRDAQKSTSFSRNKKVERE